MVWERRQVQEPWVRRGGTWVVVAGELWGDVARQGEEAG